MEQDFHGDLQVNLAWFFAVFSGVFDWIVLILVWFERSLHSAQVSRQSWPWLLKLVTSRGVERTWICTGSSGANGLMFVQGFWYFVPSWSREIHKNTQLILQNSVAIFMYNIFETYLSYWGFFAINLQIYLETSSLKGANNVPKLPGVDYVVKNWALAMMLKACHWFISGTYCC